MAAFDVFAMPTWEEPCAVAFLEAMAMAKPVVALRSGGTPEVVADGQTGFLVEPKSTEALADTLTRLLRDAQLRHQFGQEGRRRVEQVLTPQQMCRRMSDVYRAILDRTGGLRRVAEPGPSRVA
jgi:glycosyltransferase involved in cell wall biosynthesis